MADVKIINGQAMDKVLQELDGKTSRRIVGKALKEGAKPILSTTQSSVPRRTGKLAASLKIISGTKNGIKFAKVSLGGKAYTGPTFYGWFQERGWHQGKRPRGKLREHALGYGMVRESAGPDRRRFFAGKHFMEKAFDADWENSLNVIMDTLGQEIAHVKTAQVKVQVQVTL